MDWLINFFQFFPFQYHDLFVVSVLIVMEGMLSCDNAVVLALLVKNLPPEQRGKALRYGIIGAYVFRIIALSLATVILNYWFLKILAGGYLAYMAASHFLSAKDEDGDGIPDRKVTVIWGIGAFWSTVVWVELTDIAFSVDSIAAAVAVSNKLWVLVLGGLLGILAMRFAAQGFVKLLERFPRLESAAFAAVGIVGLKLLCELPADVVGLQYDLPKGATYVSAKAYTELVEKSSNPILHISSTIRINRGAVEAPQREIIERAIVAERHGGLAPTEVAVITSMRKEIDDEYLLAKARWSLDYRPFVAIEGWLSSLVVILVFCFGFIRAKPSTVKE
jgi:YkoY family integral membrane protein